MSDQNSYPAYPIRLYRVEQVAQILQCSRAQVYRLVANHTLRGDKFGALVRIREDDLDEFFKKSRIDQAG